MKIISLPKIIERRLRAYITAVCEEYPDVRLCFYSREQFFTIYLIYKLPGGRPRWHRIDLYSDFSRYAEDIDKEHVGVKLSMVVKDVFSILRIVEDEINSHLKNQGYFKARRIAERANLYCREQFEELEEWVEENL